MAILKPWDGYDIVPRVDCRPKEITHRLKTENTIGVTGAIQHLQKEFAAHVSKKEDRQASAQAPPSNSASGGDTRGIPNARKGIVEGGGHDLGDQDPGGLGDQLATATVTELTFEVNEPFTYCFPGPFIKYALSSVDVGKYYQLFGSSLFRLVLALFIKRNSIPETVAIIHR